MFSVRRSVSLGLCVTLFSLATACSGQVDAKVDAGAGSNTEADAKAKLEAKASSPAEADMLALLAKEEASLKFSAMGEIAATEDLIAAEGKSETNLEFETVLKSSKELKKDLVKPNFEIFAQVRAELNKIKAEVKGELQLKASIEALLGEFKAKIEAEKARVKAEVEANKEIIVELNKAEAQVFQACTALPMSAIVSADGSKAPLLEKVSAVKIGQPVKIDASATVQSSTSVVLNLEGGLVADIGAKATSTTQGSILGTVQSNTQIDAQTHAQAQIQTPTKEQMDAFREAFKAEAAVRSESQECKAAVASLQALVTANTKVGN